MEDGGWKWGGRLEVGVEGDSKWDSREMGKEKDRAGNVDGVIRDGDGRQMGKRGEEREKGDTCEVEGRERGGEERGGREEWRGEGERDGEGEGERDGEGKRERDGEGEGEGGEGEGREGMGRESGRGRGRERAIGSGRTQKNKKNQTSTIWKNYK